MYLVDLGRSPLPRAVHQTQQAPASPVGRDEGYVSYRCSRARNEASAVWRPNHASIAGILSARLVDWAATGGLPEPPILEPSLGVDSLCQDGDIYLRIDDLHGTSVDPSHREARAYAGDVGWTSFPQSASLALQSTRVSASTARSPRRRHQQGGRFFRHYSEQRPHQGLRYRTPGEVYRAGRGWNPDIGRGTCHPPAPANCQRSILAAGGSPPEEGPNGLERQEPLNPNAVFRWSLGGLLTFVWHYHREKNRKALKVRWLCHASKARVRASAKDIVTYS
jgi:hypothetical protein